MTESYPKTNRFWIFSNKSYLESKNFIKLHYDVLFNCCINFILAVFKVFFGRSKWMVGRGYMSRYLSIMTTSPCVWTCGFGVLWASRCCRSGAEHLRRDVSLQLLGHQPPDHPQQAVELPRWGQRQPCAGIASGKTRKSYLHPLLLQEVVH